jgi:hypothetical protein
MSAPAYEADGAEAGLAISHGTETLECTQSLTVASQQLVEVTKSARGGTAQRSNTRFAEISARQTAAVQLVALGPIG